MLNVYFIKKCKLEFLLMNLLIGKVVVFIMFKNRYIFYIIYLVLKLKNVKWIKINFVVFFFLSKYYCMFFWWSVFLKKNEIDINEFLIFLLN